MSAIERAVLAWAVIGVAANFAAAQVESVELHLGEPVRPLETLAAERTLLGVPGVGSVKVDLRRAALVVTPVAGSDLDPTTLPRTVQDAGLAVTRVGLTASGRLSTSGETPVLLMDGSMPRVELAGGAKLLEVTGDPALAGKKLRVSGTFARAGSGGPWTLTVEEWAVPPPPAEAPAADPAEPAAVP